MAATEHDIIKIKIREISMSGQSEGRYSSVNEGNFGGSHGSSRDWMSVDSVLRPASGDDECLETNNG